MLTFLSHVDLTSLLTLRCRLAFLPGKPVDSQPDSQHCILLFASLNPISLHIRYFPHSLDGSLYGSHPI